MKEFELRDEEYIELNKVLKLLGLVSNGGEAHAVIDNGEVLVNDMVEKQRRKKLRKGDVVKFGGEVVTIK